MKDSPGNGTFLTEFRTSGLPLLNDKLEKLLIHLVCFATILSGPQETYIQISYFLISIGCITDIRL